MKSRGRSGVFHPFICNSQSRGGGLENILCEDGECSTVRFVCFPCLLSTMEDESAPIKSERIENVKKQACDKCMLKNITHRPEGIYDTLLDTVSGQSVSDFSLWRASKVMVRDNELKINLTSSGICRIPAQEELDMSVQLLREKACTRLPTNGNGKCGLHAVFGEPSGAGELKVANEAHLIRRILPSDMVALQNKLSERGKELLAKVTSAIWPHYICPYMEKAPLTAEAEIFTKLLQSDRYAAVMQQCRLRYTANVYSQGRKDFAKKILLRDARSFFIADEGVKKSGR